MRKNLKIALLVDEIAPGSAPKLIGWPIRELEKLGVSCEAIVIARKETNKDHKEIFDFHLNGVNIRYISDYFPAWVQKINFTFPGMSFFSLHHIASYIFSYRAVRKSEFDMMITYCQYSTFAARSIRAWKGIPFITLLWDPSTFTAQKIYKQRFGLLYPFLYFAATRLDRFALSKCKAVITSGSFHHAHLGKLTAKTLNILYPGCFPVDTVARLESREKVILSYDRWDIGNNPEVLLQVLSKMKNKDARMTIGGFWHPYSMLEEFRTKVDEYGLSDRVEITGPLNEVDIIRHCNTSRVHLHPIHEAFGMQSLEASACGCPSIVPKGSGVCELFEHGISGYHPEPMDIVSMAEYCDLLIGDDNLWQKVSMSAYQAAKKHDWPAHARRIIDIVTSTLRKT